jgi:hypothetical protein
MMKKRFWSAAAGGLLVSLVIAGCGVTGISHAPAAGNGASNPLEQVHSGGVSTGTVPGMSSHQDRSPSLTSTRTSGPDTQAQTSQSNPNMANTGPGSFPSLIQSAMGRIAGRTSVPLYAPSIYPGSAHPPFPVTVQIFTAVGFYLVTFNRGGNLLGQFEVAAWQDPLHLSGGPPAPPLPPVPANPDSTPISLGHGITGRLEALTANHGEALVWQEGRWNMAVEFPASRENQAGAVFTASGENMAVAVASRIVAFCHTGYLPPPHLTGWMVAQFKGSNVTTELAWQQHGLSFNTASSGAWDSNLSGGYLSALQMAVSMQPY